MRINVIGTSGSGKSTFSKELAQILDIEYIEMDRLFWGKNWTPLARDAFHEKIKREVIKEAWILDGNFNPTNEIKWQRANIVIWIDFPLGRTLYQEIKRAVSRSIRQKELWPGTGIRNHFLDYSLRNLFCYGQ